MYTLPEHTLSKLDDMTVECQLPITSFPTTGSQDTVALATQVLDLINSLKDKGNLLTCLCVDRGGGVSVV